MKNIKQRYINLLTEGYRLTNSEEVYDALESNHVGVRLQPEYKNKTKWGYVCEKINIFFRKCNEYGIKDTTYGVQLLLSKCPPENLENIIRTDGLYEFLKSYKKPWVKELPEYQTLMNDKVWLGATVNDLHRFEKVVQENQSKHGNAKKGGGDVNGVKTAYDDGTWKLLIPNSFAGEKAAAFYIKDGKETPTAWCTRCNEGYYRRYTKDAPLYIIRNMKTGKSYQMAFTKEEAWDQDEDFLQVHFLDQDDVKGDKITKGDLSVIPDELLKHIKIPFGSQKGKTMTDYKNAKSVDPNEGKKGYTRNDRETYGKPQEISQEVIKKAITFSGLSGKYLEMLKDILSRQKVCKTVSKNGFTIDRSDLVDDSMSYYLNNGVKREHKYDKKAGKRKYYFEGDNSKAFHLITFYGEGNYYSNNLGFNSIPNRTEAEIKKQFLSAVADVETKRELIHPNGWQGVTTSVSKKYAKEEREIQNTKEKFEKIHDTVDSQFEADMNKLGVQNFQIYDESDSQLKYKGNTYNGMSGRVIRLVFGAPSYRSGNETTYTIPKGTPFSRKNVYWLPDTAQDYYEEREEYKEYRDEKYKDLAWKIMFAWNKLWRQNFENDIIERRANGKNKFNMYEEVNYFNY